MDISNKNIGRAGVERGGSSGCVMVVSQSRWRIEGSHAIETGRLTLREPIPSRLMFKLPLKWKCNFHTCHEEDDLHLSTDDCSRCSIVQFSQACPKRTCGTIERSRTGLRSYHYTGKHRRKKSKQNKQRSRRCLSDINALQHYYSVTIQVCGNTNDCTDKCVFNQVQTE